MKVKKEKGRERGRGKRKGTLDEFVLVEEGMWDKVLSVSNKEGRKE